MKPGVRGWRPRPGAQTREAAADGYKRTHTPLVEIHALLEVVSAPRRDAAIVGLEPCQPR